MYRAYKYRIYPNSEQRNLIDKAFSCSRYVYNHFLSRYDKEEKEKHRGPNNDFPYTRYKSDLWKLKRENTFLMEVEPTVLTNALLNLNDSFKNYYQFGKNYPKFKSRYQSRQSFTVFFYAGSFSIREKSIWVSKIGTIKAKLHRRAPLDYELRSITLSMEADGKYYVSILYSFVREIENVHPAKAIGYDYKSRGLYTASDGSSCNTVRYFENAQKKLKRAQRKLRKKTKDSNNYKKQKIKIAKIYRAISNKRNDFLHKETTRIANENDLVAIENLSMIEMASRTNKLPFRMGKSVQDNAWGSFTFMLRYKLQDRGKYLVKVSKWYPSSQICSACKYRNTEVKNVSIRRWTCPNCGKTLDRDINAARNVRREAIRLFNTYSRKGIFYIEDRY